MKYSVLIATLQKLNLLGFKPKQALFAKILGLSTASMSARVKRDSEFSEEELCKLEEVWAISIPRDVANEIEVDYYPNKLGVCQNKEFIFSDDKKNRTIKRESLLADIVSSMTNFKKYFVTSFTGDSMQPYIYEGDKIIVEHYEGDQIKDNKVYVFCYDNELFVRRLTNNITQVVIKSDNPLYDPIKIEAKDPKFLILGEVVGIIKEIV